MNARTPATNAPCARRPAWAVRAAVLGLGLASALGLAALAPSPAQAGIIGGAGEVEKAALSYAKALEGASVVVTGTASVTVEPDVARVTLSATAEAASASEAASDASAKAASVRDALMAAGVAQGDLQTSGAAVYPRYAYGEDGAASVAGYTASVNFTVSGVPVADVADVVGGALDAGATQVDELAYYASTYDERYAEALAKAAAQAAGKARTLAAAQLGADDASALVLEKLEEEPSSQAYRYADASGAGALASEASASKANVWDSVNPGTIEITASVTATYRAWDEDALARATNGDGQAVDVIGVSRAADSATSER